MDSVAEHELAARLERSKQDNAFVKAEEKEQVEQVRSFAVDYVPPGFTKNEWIAARQVSSLIVSNATY